jgi:hypothetical protein
LSLRGILKGDNEAILTIVEEEERLERELLGAAGMFRLRREIKWMFESKLTDSSIGGFVGYAQCPIIGILLTFDSEQ